jgi:acetylornithine deacetylase
MNSLQSKTLEFLNRLIGIPSTRSHEGSASRYIANQIAPYTDQCKLVPVPESIKLDPDYSFPLPGLTYQDTPNVECVIRGKGEIGPIIFNAHVDVVPPSEDQVDPFNSRLENGIIYGRGACDDKGPLATLFALAVLLHERRIIPPGDLIFHFVIEEEVGGNGTLAMIRRGVNASAAVILEPTDLAIIPTVRGAVWFTLTLYGKAAHSGNISGRVNALEKAFDAIQILKHYHDRLLAASRGLPLFDVFPDPMPLTIGQCNAGNWPASVPSVAVLKGLLGFLPNHNRHEIQQELRDVLFLEGDEWLKDHFKLDFNMLNNDGNMIPVDHPLVISLRDALLKNGLPPVIRAQTAACDAWQYNNLAGIPTVVFGPGSLSYAHSKEEQIRFGDILQAADVLADFVVIFDGKK